jgi:rhamnosyltransferase subunit B
MPIGSHGDMHPFLGLANALKQRGHCVKFIANDLYAPLAAGLGLEFVPVGTAEEYRVVARDPDVWHQLKGPRKLGRFMGQVLPGFYRAILEHAVPGKTVLVYSTLNFAARSAEESLGIPGVSVHLAPLIFFSAYDPPKVVGMPIPKWLPLAVRRLYMQGALGIADKDFGPPLNAFRKTLNLPPVRGVWKKWFHSTKRVIGMFPDWFAPIQPDWPPQTVLTGFPLYDEAGLTPLPDELIRFLDSGSPPIAFTPGSAMYFGHEFFNAAARACQTLGRRGILLTRHAEQIPARLPDGVIHVPYAPFSQLLPRCAAVVHHGGIGSTSQGFAAGVPQLMMPMAYDQLDNASRAEKLGVADWLVRKKFTAKNVSSKLDPLISSAAVAEACKRIAAKFKSAPDPLEQSVNCIEQISP